MARTSPFALIDLCFPVESAPLADIALAADRHGLDAVLLVADSVAAVPAQAELAALAGRCRFHPVVCVAGAGFRFAIVAPRGIDGFSLEAVESSGDPKVVQAAARSLGGVALPISPRQSGLADVARQVPQLPSDPVGVVSLVASGSRLARDLDIEDTGIAERRVLGGTGPFGQLADLGRYATLLPARADDLVSIVGALQRGLGIAVELVARRQPPASARHRRPDPHEGREHERPGPESVPDKKKRRRRRRSKKAASGAAPSE